MTRVVVITEDNATLWTGAVDKPIAELGAEVAAALKAPGSVLTLHAKRDLVVIPVRSIAYVRVEPEDGGT